MLLSTHSSHFLPYLVASAVYIVTLISALVALGFRSGKICSVGAHAKYERFKINIQVQGPAHNSINYRQENET